MWMMLLAGCGFLSSAPPTLRAGGYGFCLIDGSTVSCWGAGGKGMHGSDYGEPCDEGRCADRPVAIAAYAGADDVQLDYATVLVLKDGVLSSRGNDHYGTLGLAASVPRGVCTVGGDVVPKCALDLDSEKVVCAGEETSPKVALACTDTLAERSRDVRWIRAGTGVTCEGRTDGSLWCAGSLKRLAESPDTCGSYGDPCARVPVRLEDSAAIDVQAGTYGGCVLHQGGSLRCAGGQHSTGFDGATGVRAMAVGHQHTCVLKEDGSVWCSGWNAHGQIGNGQVGEPAAPTVPPTKVLDDIRSLATADSTTCAVKNDGSLWCWGRNELGQVGQGHTRAEVPTPARVEGLPTVHQVVVSGDAVCVVGDDASVWCWGGNTHGELGVGTARLEQCEHGAIFRGAVSCASRPREVR